MNLLNWNEKKPNLKNRLLWRLNLLLSWIVIRIPFLRYMLERRAVKKILQAIEEYKKSEV